jgi:FkbM family methyltransferase
VIHQCYFEASQRARLFASPLYRGFGLYPAVNPDITRNCPELANPAHQPLLSEYAALLHLWRNPELDPDPWIGFTSYRQLDKFPTIVEDRQAVERALTQADILGWGFYAFTDAATGRPLTLAEQGERSHPGITSALWQLFLRCHEPMPVGYFTETSGLFCNYWVMGKLAFDEFMRWSWPLVRWALNHPDPFRLSHPRSLSYLAERLFICWYLSRHKRLLNVGTLVRLPCAPVPGGLGTLDHDAPTPTTLFELCHRHQVQPRGIIHVGAHYAEERHVYRRLGVRHVLWIEADPEHLGPLRANLAGFPEARIVQACLSDVDSESTTFYRTNNRGESSSILPLGTHREHFPEIYVVGTTQVASSTFIGLVERESISLDLYDFLVMDIQGAELRALRGFGQHLARFHGVFIEVNLGPLYQGGALLPEIDAYLSEFGLIRREILLTPKDYGDALYSRAEAGRQGLGIR